MMEKEQVYPKGSIRMRRSFYTGSFYIRFDRGGILL